MFDDFPIYIQYENSPKLKSLVNKTANSLLLKDLNFTNDYLSIKTASTNGLDNWGIILNQSRNVNSGDSYENVLGFDTGEIPTNDEDYPQNLFNSNFYNINFAPTLTLEDNKYRALLLLLYAKYTMNNSIFSINKAIQEYSNNMGKSEIPVVYSTYDMRITYKFNYQPENYELNLFFNTDLLPKPCGVLIDFIFI